VRTSQPAEELTVGSSSGGSSGTGPTGGSGGLGSSGGLDGGGLDGGGLDGGGLDGGGLGGGGADRRVVDGGAVIDVGGAAADWAVGAGPASTATDGAPYARAHSIAARTNASDRW